MGVLRIHEDEKALLDQLDLPWFHGQARNEVGLPALGVPQAEVDANGDPTGYLLYAHPRLTEERYQIDVVKAEHADLRKLPTTKGDPPFSNEEFEALYEAAYAEDAADADVLAYEAALSEFEEYRATPDNPRKAARQQRRQRRWAAHRALKARVERGEISRREAKALSRAEIDVIAVEVKVPRPVRDPEPEAEAPEGP